MYFKTKDNLGWFNFKPSEINTDDLIEITEEEWDAHINEMEMVEFPESTDNELRIMELKQLLSDTDYKAIKYAEGEMSEEEYAPIKAQRRAWREEINQLTNK